MVEIQGVNYYSTHAEQYHQTTFSVDPTSFLTPLAARVTPHAEVLDIGCGSGRDLNWLKQKGFRVIGLERSPGLAQRAREMVGCRILEEDFELFDFSSISVDVIVIVGGLVHVPQPKVPDLLHRFLAALRPNGLLLLTTKEGTGSSSDSTGREFFLWQDAELRAVFDRLGLELLDCFRNLSRLGTQEVWLGYVLRKPERP
jgi:SAM-dependent methyltransferase